MTRRPDTSSCTGRPATGRPGGRPQPDLAAYRAAVAGLVASLERSDAAGSPRLTARILSRRLADPEIAAVIDHTPQGSAGALERLLLEIRGYRPGSRGSSSLPALLRISMLAQIDALWWGREVPYPTDEDVLAAGDLLDLDALREGGLLRFRYRHQPATLAGRVARSVERRTMPGRAPLTAGMWLARARPAAVALLNQVAAEFADRAPRGTPPLWVTSMARSVEHQRRLRALGYAALLPSSHCVGYAADVEMTWFRRFGAHRALAGGAAGLAGRRATSTSSTRARPGTCACAPASATGPAWCPRPACRAPCPRPAGADPCAASRSSSARPARTPTTCSAACWPRWRPRGETLEARCAAGLLAGTQRLRIVDRDAAVQPWVSAGGRLRAVLQRRAVQLPGAGRPAGRPGHGRSAAASDTAVVLAAFTHWGEEAVTRFRGEFAIAIADTSAQRDVPGPRPGSGSSRCTGRAGAARLHVASEIKALVPLGAAGARGPARPPRLGRRRAGAGAPPVRGAPDVTWLARWSPSRPGRPSWSGPRSRTRPGPGGHRPDRRGHPVRRPGQLADPAARRPQMHPDCVAFTIGAPGSEDLRYARRLCADLGVRHEVIEVEPRRIGLADIRAAIAMSELTEYGDIINAVVSMPLFRRPSGPPGSRWC